MPLRRKRFFVTEKTSPKIERPGFTLPRYDARMHDGDEVVLKGYAWISLASVPPGPAALKGSRSNQFCGLRGDTLSCHITDESKAQMIVQDEDENGRVALLVGGKYCRDTPQRVVCDADKFPGDAGSFLILDMHDGKMSMRGGRAFGFCSDRDEGVVCDKDTPSLWELFTFHSKDPLRTILAQSADPRWAAVFVVSRSSMESPDVALLCKASGKYVSLDEQSGVVGCFANVPQSITYRRIDGQKWWTPNRGTFTHPGTGKSMSTLKLEWGGAVRAGGSSQGMNLLSIQLRAGYEDVSPLVRGVNLGNWFVLEKWMDHKLFLSKDGTKFAGECEAIDEYGIMQLLDDDTKRQRMEGHWSSWIKEEDIKWLATHGINTVRVPFGYWMTHPEPPFIEGQFKYLKKLFEWCEKHSVAVLLDFHGLKGSQQGQSTSGNCGACTHKVCGVTWVRYLEFEDTNLAVISNLTAHFSKSPVYMGFGVANELGGRDGHKAMSFYQKAYDIIRGHNKHAFVFLYPTFRPETYPFQNEAFMAQDNHIYFRALKGGAGFDHPRNVERAKMLLMGSSQRWQVLVGEWSIGGYGGYLGRLTPAEVEDWYRNFGKAQLQAYEQHSMGWVYWSYKTIYPGSLWNYREMCERGRLPGCSADFKYRTNDWWSHHPCTFNYLEDQNGSKGCASKNLFV